MNDTLLDRKGMTLIEALVAGVIGVIISGVIVVMYLMYNRQLQESTAQIGLQMQQSNVSLQVAAYARNAHKILDSTETDTDSCRSFALTSTAVTFHDTAGLRFAGIGISGNTLIEWDAIDKVWQPYNAGGGPVTVDTASSFILNGCRNAITVDLRFRQPFGDTVAVTGTTREVYRCRN